MDEFFDDGQANKLIDLRAIFFYVTITDDFGLPQRLFQDAYAETIEDSTGEN